MNGVEETMSGTAPRIDIQSGVAMCIEGITAATTILAVQYFHFQFQPQGIALQWEAATKLQQLQIQIKKAFIVLQQARHQKQ